MRSPSKRRFMSQLRNDVPHCRETLPVAPAMKGLCGKEALDNHDRVFRVFFWEEVATLYRLSLRARSPLSPNAQRPPVLCIERVEWATLGPEMQHQAFDPLGCFLVSTIVFDIDRCGGAIFLTDAVHARL